jgi:hypothetical protein
MSKEEQDEFESEVRNVFEETYCDLGLYSLLNFIC